MLMGSSHLAPTDVLSLFYGINGAILLGLLVIVGTAWAARSGRGQPWQWSPPHGTQGRRVLVLGLSGFWLLDGILQAQPLMATSFASDLMAPTLQGQPSWLHGMLSLGIGAWNSHPISADILVIWLQISVGLLIAFGRDDRWRRRGLWMSLGWAAIVWVMGEGFGDILAGGSWLLGSPGSALFYVLASAWALLPVNPGSAPSPRQLFAPSQIVLWSVAALMQAWPGSPWWRGPHMATYFRSQAAMPQPHLIASPLYTMAGLARYNTPIINGVLVGLFLLCALLWTFPAVRHVAWWVTVGVILGTWWIGQDFGVLGGMGTDPNASPILLLLLIAYRGSSPTPRKVHDQSGDSSLSA